MSSDMGKMSIAELLSIVMAIAGQHPEAVDFAYPIRRGGRRFSQLGPMSGYSILMGSGREIARFEIDWAPSWRHDPQETPANTPKHDP